jgi:hypothetical protein
LALVALYSDALALGISYSSIERKMVERIEAKGRAPRRGEKEGPARCFTLPTDVSSNAFVEDTNEERLIVVFPLTLSSQSLNPEFTRPA